ncbi:S41 family peptidase [Sungkyunkwania multivorans]|uniref:S41 family peptidase n=1 Tax=Sungkyunkwania multivorans TaxID=1173618 RepID=A0ABW3CWR1_9FLAO
MAICFTSISCTSTRSLKLDNPYRVDLESDDIGKVTFYMDYVEEEDGFELFSPKNTDKKLFGSAKAFLGRIFGANMHKGSLLYVKGESQGDRITGTATSPLGILDFEGELVDGNLSGSLTRKGKDYASITGKRAVTITDIRDYDLLVNKVLKVTEDRIYDKNMVHHPDWKKFKKKLLKKTADVKDDLELVSLFHYMSKELPFSHYALLNYDFTPKFDLKEVTLEELNERTVLLTIPSFNTDVDALDQLLDMIYKKQYENLIIDLRKNTGGNIESSYLLGAFLIEQPLVAGHFLTQDWFQQHQGVPNKDNIKDLRILDKGDLQLLRDGINNSQGVTLKILPDGRKYKGNVFILTSNKTASAAEPLVFGLRETKLATVIGENTSGAMLSAEVIEIDDDYNLFLPIADYFTASGVRLEGKGVAPNIAVDSKEALDMALEVSRKTTN